MQKGTHQIESPFHADMHTAIRHRQNIFMVCQNHLESPLIYGHEEKITSRRFHSPAPRDVTSMPNREHVRNFD
jgi:hypothetical protein